MSMSFKRSRLDEQRQVAESLYEALAAGDADTIRLILSDDFRGHVTPGMPMGAGGDHVGADTMMKRVWWAIGTNFRARAVPDEFRQLDDGRLFVRGHYRGHGRATGAELDAEFIHLLTFDDTRVSSLEQLTDSAEWRDALGDTNDTIARIS